MYNWRNFYKNIRIFCEKSAEYEDVFEFFLQNETDMIELANRMENHGIDDLRVRLKEQNIKIRLLAKEMEHDKGITYRWFEPYEDICPGRKLQFFLYTSGYWEKAEMGTDAFGKLKEYLEKGEKWFFDYCKNEKEFLEKYALTANMNDENELSGAEDINSKAGENKHIWEKNKIFWNDVSEENEGWKLYFQFENQD